MIESIFGAVLQIVLWLVKRSNAGDKRKKAFLDFVKAMGKASLVSADLHSDYKRQLKDNKEGEK